MTHNDKFNQLFKVLKASNVNAKAKQNGGSYASDAVTGQLDSTAFERINFLLSGGDCGCGSKKGGNPPSAIPMASLDQPSGLPPGIMTSLSQPLSTTSSYTDSMSFPSNMSAFYPALGNR